MTNILVTKAKRNSISGVSLNPNVWYYRISIIVQYLWLGSESPSYLCYRRNSSGWRRVKAARTHNACKHRFELTWNTMCSCGSEYVDTYVACILCCVCYLSWNQLFPIVSSQGAMAPTTVNTAGWSGWSQRLDENDRMPTRTPSNTAGPPASCCGEDQIMPPCRVVSQSVFEYFGSLQ